MSVLLNRFKNISHVIYVKIKITVKVLFFKLKLVVTCFPSFQNMVILPVGPRLVDGATCAEGMHVLKGHN